jgi:hypothetical protein
MLAHKEPLYEQYGWHNVVTMGAPFDSRLFANRVGF